MKYEYDPDNQDSRLFQYFAGYFSQDFDIYAPTWEGVVEYYCRCNAREIVQEGREDLAALLANTPDDAELERKVLDYGCQLYAPEEEPYSTYRKWIVGMIAIMDECLANGTAGVDQIRKP